jgi:hypothetical protein
MSFSAALRKGVLLLVFLACAAPPLRAQIGDQIKAYTGLNAVGYLQPLSDAIGAEINSAIFRTGHVDKKGLTIRLELPVMGVIFPDDAKTFSAVTECGFSPTQRVSAPTVVGSEKAVIVEGDGGTAFAFPGGLNLHSFGLAVPQLRVGNLFGTEAIVRGFVVRTGGEDVGDFTLFGIGAHHSISQYLPPDFPVDMAAGFFWQTSTVESGTSSSGDLMSATAFTIGVQASTRLAKVFLPYGGLSYDTFSMEVSYDSEAGCSNEKIDINFDRVNTMHLTLGVQIDIPVMNMFLEYNIASQNSFALGVGFGIGG